MSEKMTCPACDARTTSVLDHYANGDPCPHCGLSSTAMAEILAIRRRDADAELTRKLEEALKRVDTAEREARELRWRLEQLQEVMTEEPPDWLHSEVRDA